ncbi:hypothetical protein FJT64_022026 [Amphibalanus amphitrite]|uniref:Uncharacterized protein n=1 Tax=Amphibalanus amphitrite TaxID=1232801 RepID=A0A6A4WI98_AMPAM|nr:hypothetical protein FJT64_022026 [Amphibalanus amphitrite]
MMDRNAMVLTAALEALREAELKVERLERQLGLNGTAAVHRLDDAHNMMDRNAMVLTAALEALREAELKVERLERQLGLNGTAAVV